MDRDFWQGLRLVSSGLVDAAKKASYSVGCGAGGLGLSLWGVGVLGITGPASLLIPMATFFLLARLGRVLDERAERRSLDDRLEELLMIQQKLSERQLKLTDEQIKGLTELADIQKKIMFTALLSEKLDKENK